MKTLIIYYSYSGMTDKVANMYANILRKKGEVSIQRLKPKQEIASFMGQCRAAFGKKRAELQDGITYDVKDYDLLIIGSPVWAFAPTPAVNTYLDKLSNLQGKKTLMLLTSGSGTGVKKCFKNIRAILESKGASKVDEINIPNAKMKDEGFITSSLEKII